MNPIAQLITSLHGEGPTYSAVGDVYTILAASEQSGGAYTLLRASVPPGGGPPPHFHQREEESFFILEGEITFMVNDKAVVAGPGGFVQMPRGVPHAFKNTSGQVARMLILCVPAGFDQFMREFAQPLPSPDAAPLPVTQAEIEKLLAVAPRYGIQMLPPPH